LFSAGHLPFPGIGCTTKSGSGYVFVPGMQGEL
jgi:hypothetical protein